MYYKTGIVIFLALSLAACSHKNTLSENNSTEVSKAIQTAAISAEKTMKRKKHTSGSIYEVCMEQHYSNDLSKKDCQTLYSNMLTVLKKQPGYSHVTLKDLTNQTMYREIKNDYRNVVFNTLPEF